MKTIVEKTIKQFESKTGFIPISIYDAGDEWLIDGREKESLTFANDPYYLMDKKTGLISHFVPQLDPTTYAKAIKNPVYNLEISEDQKQSEWKRFKESFLNDEE